MPTKTTWAVPNASSGAHTPTGPWARSLCTSSAGQAPNAGDERWATRAVRGWAHRGGRGSVRAVLLGEADEVENVGDGAVDDAARRRGHRERRQREAPQVGVGRRLGPLQRPVEERRQHHEAHRQQRVEDLAGEKVRQLVGRARRPLGAGAGGQDRGRRCARRMSPPRFRPGARGPRPRTRQRRSAGSQSRGCQTWRCRPGSTAGGRWQCRRCGCGCRRRGSPARP